MATGIRPGGHRTRTPRQLAKFIEEGVPAVLDRAPSPTELAYTEVPVAAGTPTPPAAPVVYQGPEQDPWETLRRNLPPEAIAALEQVTGKPAVGAGNAPWYECWDVMEGRPTGHPPFQGFVKPGQHVYCPYINEKNVTCGRKTVKPLEGYVPA
jgi:hypothetical protein